MEGADVLLQSLCKSHGLGDPLYDFIMEQVVIFSPLISTHQYAYNKISNF